MLKFILRRCLEAIPTLFILITISFFMMRLAPGSPFTGERTLPPEVMANIEAKYHLNDPIMTQYFNYLKQLAHGDFGPSFKYKDYSVNDLVADWDRKYSREQGCFPPGAFRVDKYWPPVGRVDNVYGDRHLICTCPPVESYAEAAE